MVRVLFDTNVLISAAYSQGSVPHKVLEKATKPPFQPLICETNLEELRKICKRKFPHKAAQFEQFITEVLSFVEVIPVPPTPHPDEEKIRDIDDRPILRAAIEAGVDILLTGDKDFLESTITNPKIMTAIQYVQIQEIE